MNAILVSSKEAAEIISISESTLRKSRVSGVLLGKTAPNFIKMGGKVVYRAQDLLDWVDQFVTYRSTSQY